MEKIGKYKHKKTTYQVWKSGDGMLELWHSIGGDKRLELSKSGDEVAIYKATDYTRIVTNVTSIDDLPAFFTRPVKKVKVYDPYLDKNQMKIE